MIVMYVLIQILLVLYFLFTLYKARKSNNPEGSKYGQVIILVFVLPMAMFWLHSMTVQSQQVFFGKLDSISFGKEIDNYKATIYPFIQYDLTTLEKIKIDDSKVDGLIVIHKYSKTDVKMYTSYNDFYYKKEVIEKKYLCSDFHLNFQECVGFIKNKQLL